MFVKNLTKTELLFKKNGSVLKIQPGINLIDSLKWNKEDLEKTYGPSILLVFNGEENEKIEEPKVKIEEPAKEIVEPESEDAEPKVETPEVAEPEAEAEDKKEEVEVKAPAKNAKAKNNGKKSNK